MTRNSEDQGRQSADPDYDIGYGRPPTKFQFRKGISGNPNGRPPGQTREKRLKVAVANVPPKGSWLTDEELLQIVKERRLSLDALVDAYKEETPQTRSKARTKSRPPRSQRPQES